MSGEMTPMERTVSTLGFEEPDRVPLFLLLTMHGAKELGLSIQEYYSKAEHVIKGQILLQKKYQSDCYIGFCYAAAEIEAFGGDTIFFDNGPPNAGQPIIRDPGDIGKLSVPEIETSPSLIKVLDIIAGLYAHAQDTIPINGVVISPFSIPVMQMGFEAYLDLLYDHEDLFWNLMDINVEFSVAWANAQLKAGATAIAYFDPVSSPTCIPPELYRKTGQIIAKRTIARIKGPTATHMASGLILPIIDDLAETGTAIVGVSAHEDIGVVKNACNRRMTVLGNLNGIEMRRWTPEYAEAAVKDAIAKAGPGGGFILSDNHGEIPWQVTDEVLTAICSAVRTWGRYPLDWTR
ncbi:MAG TPA: uroporphyrinogen decarboxylase family protein [Methanospirillum sp.]|nr:uroporphyrinogen decarboxylase family protein [Methanospirillum sp.]